MGNNVSNGSPSTGKVILLDGSIQEFDKPLTVAELMLEYPQQVVVELNSTSSVTPKKPTPLPADNILERNKIYLMVPLKKGRPAYLSPQEAHHILLRVNAVLRSKTLVSSTSKFLPFFAKICPASAIHENNYKFVVSKKEVLAHEGEEKEDVDDVVAKPDCLSRKVSGRNWKPSLDTIEEKRNEMKRAINLVMLANKVGRRIQCKGLVWG